MFKTCSLLFNNRYSTEDPNKAKLNKILGDKALVKSLAKGIKSTLSISEMFGKKSSSAPFNSDVDNFIGVKNIKNYIISSLNDIDESGNTHSVGVIQLFNKNRGEIDDEDIERLRSI